MLALGHVERDCDMESIEKYEGTTSRKNRIVLHTHGSPTF